MRKAAAFVLASAGLLSVLLSGCQTGKEPAGGMPEHGAEQVMGTEQEPESETEKKVPGLPYQFVRKYGIIQSKHPVYELDQVIEFEIPQKNMSVSLTSAICHNQELIVDIVLYDYSEAEKIPAGGKPPEDGMYYTLGDGAMISSERYQNELWTSGEGLFLTGTGIPEAGIKPQESEYASHVNYIETYGHRRYFMAARFELPSAPDHEAKLSGYGLRILDFEKPLEFAIKPAPEYGTLEELAAGERGSMDTHDGISVISMGEKVNEGILVTWYEWSEGGDKQISLTYKPPLQEMDLPTISSEGKQYHIKQSPANAYWEEIGPYRLSDVQQYGMRYRCLFDVPRKEQDGDFQVNIPGITFLGQEETEPVTLAIPNDYEELNEDLLLKDGSVRILGITRMKEPQTLEIPDGQGGTKVRESPAVYIDVAAVHEDKDLALKGLLCQRKLKWTGWERGRYDFDEKGSIGGFRIFYDEGDTEITLKFSHAAFYWNQPYVMELLTY